MATDLRNLPAFLGDDATFRSWAQGIDAQLIACGMVQTADTGQVDLSTAVRPAVNVYAGYRMYRFNDSLQATKPVFLKVEYGIGSVADRPALRCQVSSATSGAGTPTGQVGAQFLLTPPSSKTVGITLPSYVCGDGSGLRMCSHIDASAAGFRLFMVIERARNANGTINGVGLFVYASGSANSIQHIPYTGTPPTASGAASVLPSVGLGSSNGALSQFGAEVALLPYFCVLGRPYSLLGLLGYMATVPDLGELVPVSTSWLGAAHTFMPLGDGGPQGPTSSNFVAILWE